MENLWLLGVHFMQGYFFGRPAPRITRQSQSFSLAQPVPQDVALEGNQMLDPDLIRLSSALSEPCRTAPLFLHQGGQSS
jgi:hypothetical protein